jgi:hypothetical protein
MDEVQRGSGRKKLLVRGLIVLGVLIAVLLIALGGNWLIGWSRAKQLPPTVLVHQPPSGASFYPNTIVAIDVEAWGSAPILRTTLWMDGKVSDETTNTQQIEAVFFSHFELTLPEGPHMIVVRAVDENGHVGQSLPLPIFGDPQAGQGPDLLNWVAEDGQSLADLAALMGEGADALDGVNPGVGDGGLPGGTVVQLPLPPANNAPPPKADVVMPEPIPVEPPAVPALDIITGRDLIQDLLSVRHLLIADAPVGMKAEYRDCNIILEWQDRSEREARFDIWMAGLGGASRVIASVSASPGTGLVWTQFDAPQVGLYSFWVEAVNIFGSQPSEVAWVGVPPDQGCAPSLATHLQVDLLNLLVPGQYDRFYCYVSVNGFPAKRFPAEDGVFIQLLGEPINALIGQELSFSVPIPESKTVMLEGECLGWVGSDLNNLGPFRADIPESLWNGEERVTGNNVYEIHYSVSVPGSSTATSVVKSERNLVWPVPYDLQLVSTPIPGNQPLHILHWQWDGDPNQIAGFLIHTNGVLTGLTTGDSMTVRIPNECGKTIRFTVEAFNGDIRSLPSEEYAFSTDPCELYAVVEFLSLNIYGEVDDISDCLFGVFPAENCSPYGKICDGYQAVGWIYAEGTNYQRTDIGTWGGNIESYWPVNCYGNEPYYPHSIKLMTGGDNGFIVGLDPQNPVLNFGAFFIDLDDGPNNIFCGFNANERDLPPNHLSPHEWTTYDDQLEIDCSVETQATVVVHIRGFTR